MTTPVQPYADRDLRQREIVPPEKLARCHALIVGVGAIGRQVALQLAAVGIPSMDLIDFDSVEEVNLAPQGYWPADICCSKVHATAKVCQSINPAIRISEHNDRFRRSSARTLLALHDHPTRVAVFACVDSITTRELIWDTVREQAAFFADGRMSAETLRVLASDRPLSDAYYGTTIFAEAEAHAGSCTARSTLYTASIAAGLMLGQFTRWLRGLPVDRDVMLNLLSMELSVL
jgi:molybdopterin/thiamine biosynthesis adenylyltransferase